MKKTLCLLALAFLAHVAGFAQKRSWMLFSPSKNIKVVVGLTEVGEPYYSVDFHGKRVVEKSKLGFREKYSDWSSGFKWLSPVSTSKRETWAPVWGEVDSILDWHHELLVRLQKANNGPKMFIRFRAFNDGVGFRYEFPMEGNGDYMTFQEELTEFRMTADHTCWWNPLDFDTNEHPYATSKLSEIDAAKFGFPPHSEPFNAHKTVQFGVNTPVTMRTATGTHIAIAEAALVNYGAMQLAFDPKTLVFKSKIIPTADSTVIANIVLPFQTPWRCVLLSKDAAGLLNSKMILNLNEPCKIEGDKSWIQPMKYVGVWWGMHVGKFTWNLRGPDGKPTGMHGANTATVKQYIDFAAKNGIKGVLVEGWNEGWDAWFNVNREEVFDFTKPYPDYDMAELSRYAREKGVKIIMHHETSAAIQSFERQMEAAHNYMIANGIDAVKTGYVGHIIPRGEWHDGQYMVNHYQRVTERTAAKRIMLDAHEPVRPSGLHRTWPNYMSSEAARGMEYNNTPGGNPPEHECILPFTRLLGGPMDYTPGMFEMALNKFDTTRLGRVQTTVAKQLALYVTLYSPLQMAADLPENYEKRPDVFQFIRDVPVDWSDTRVLNAAVGDHLTIARREKGGENWFLGSITDENARDFTVKLNFLAPGKTYEATIYEDGKDADWKANPYPVNIRKVTVRRGSVLNLKLAAGGGAAVAIKVR
ncbi:MAG: glycoside hydrolase family 97 protein [Saprospiraceae bacterium]